MVSTHLKNISQIGNLPQIGVKIKKMKPPPSINANKPLLVWGIYSTLEIWSGVLGSQEASWCRNCCVWLLHLQWKTFSKKNTCHESWVNSIHASVPNVAHLVAWICWRKQVEYVFHKNFPQFYFRDSLRFLVTSTIFFLPKSPQNRNKSQALGEGSRTLVQTALGKPQYLPEEPRNVETGVGCICGY